MFSNLMHLNHWEIVYLVYYTLYNELTKVVFLKCIFL